MIAGPNGSGKTTLFDLLAEQSFRLGHYLNPDRLERELSETRHVSFSPWGIDVDERALREFVAAHGLGQRITDVAFTVRDNTITVGHDVRGGYFAAILADFMRHRWIETGQAFTFETVMSNRDKVDLLVLARSRGYRTYVYYVCTDSPLINRERVAGRVASGGHPVPDEKIDARYTRSLSLLPAAVRAANRAYLFDNSTLARHRLIAEFEAGRLTAASAELPAWFVDTGLLDLGRIEEG
jgi:predicted ABC-type ATPase